MPAIKQRIGFSHRRDRSVIKRQNQLNDSLATTCAEFIDSQPFMTVAMTMQKRLHENFPSLEAHISSYRSDYNAALAAELGWD